MSCLGKRMSYSYHWTINISELDAIGACCSSKKMHYKKGCEHTLDIEAKALYEYDVWKCSELSMT